MFNQLLTLGLENDDMTQVDSYPTQLLESWERDMVKYTKLYKRQYSEYPTPARVAKEYPHFIPMMPTSSKGLLELVVRDRVLKSFNTLLSALPSLDVDDAISLFNTMEPRINAKPSHVMDLATVTPDVYTSNPMRFSAITETLDETLENFMSGELVTLYGPSGIGKSLVAGNAAVNWLLEGYNVVLISADMKPSTAVARLHSIGISANSKDVLKGEYDKLKMDSFINVLNLLPNNLFVPDANVSTPSQIAALARENEADIIIVDGTYFLRASSSRNGGLSRSWGNMSRVSQELKEIAHQEDKLVFSITQQNEEGNIAFTKAIEQDSDITIHLEPHEAFTEEDDRVYLRMTVKKARRTKKASARIRLDFNTTKTTDQGKDVKAATWVAA